VEIDGNAGIGEGRIRGRGGRGSCGGRGRRGTGRGRGRIVDFEGANCLLQESIIETAGNKELPEI
jgi:hypothetical protein